MYNKKSKRRSMKMTKINITLPEDVYKILQTKVKSRSKSAFICDAIRNYSKKKSQEKIIKKIVTEYSSYELNNEDKEWLSANLGRVKSKRN